MIRYIGKSTSGLKRPKEHAQPNRLKGKSRKNNWIKSLKRQGLAYGVATLECLEVENTINLCELERWWIAYGRALGWPLTNLTDGGEGSSGCVPGPESRAKMRAKQLGRKHTPEIKAKIKAANEGKCVSLETRAKLSNSRKGKSLSPETKAKISAAHKGRVISEETKQKLRESMQTYFAKNGTRKQTPEEKGKHRRAALGNKHVLGKTWKWGDGKNRKYDNG